ncbi:Hypothetical Protein OBI_RACECAR_314 [Arthrobacter phage Racecar]|nr:hypothetical protein PBI_RACECAR_106 [Arthrobacter phage Racecar]QFG12782.1 hypothetical protein PBI_MIMI_103 [Arthrobacter phage Mimi]
MTASVITKLEANTEDATFGRTPYRLEIKGAPAHGVRVTELMDPNTGQKSVELIVPAPDGSPALPLSTMDAVARRIKDGARVIAKAQGNAWRRVYA